MNDSHHNNPQAEQAGAGNSYQPVVCSELSVARTVSLLAALGPRWLGCLIHDVRPIQYAA